MKLNTPRWWYSRDRRHAPVARMLLKPASWIWSGVTARRIARAAPVDPGAPVISIGNLTVGGSGKTPIAREVLRLLHAQGIKAAALSRGYGGMLEGPVQVDLAVHTAATAALAPATRSRAIQAGASAASISGSSPTSAAVWAPTST